MMEANLNIKPFKIFSPEEAKNYRRKLALKIKEDFENNPVEISDHFKATKKTDETKAF